MVLGLSCRRELALGFLGVLHEAGSRAKSDHEVLNTLNCIAHCGVTCQTGGVFQLSLQASCLFQAKLRPGRQGTLTGSAEQS